eukprot:3261670-Amphidinium_carterae.1
MSMFDISLQGNVVGVLSTCCRQASFADHSADINNALEVLSCSQVTLQTVSNLHVRPGFGTSIDNRLLLHFCVSPMLMQ